MEENTNKHKLDDIESSQHNPKKKVCLEQTEFPDHDEITEESKHKSIESNDEDKMLLSVELSEPQTDSLTSTTSMCMDINNDPQENSSFLFKVPESKENISHVEDSEQLTSVEPSEENISENKEVPISEILESCENNLSSETVTTLKDIDDVEVNEMTDISSDHMEETKISQKLVNITEKLEAVSNSTLEKKCDADIEMHITSAHSEPIKTENISSSQKEIKLVSILEKSSCVGIENLPKTAIHLNEEGETSVSTIIQDHLTVTSDKLKSSLIINPDRSLDYSVKESKTDSQISTNIILPSLDSKENNMEHSLNINKGEISSIDLNEEMELAVHSKKIITAEETENISDSNMVPASLGCDLANPKNIQNQLKEIDPKPFSTSLECENIIEDSPKPVDTMITNNHSSSNKSNASDKDKLTEEYENNTASSKLTINSFKDVCTSKTDAVSMQSENTEPAILIGMIENSNSLSGTFYSNENSPAFSTPVESCQVSAASSPKPFDALSKLSDDQGSLNIDGKPVAIKSVSKKKSKQKSKKQRKAVSRPIVIDEETRMDAILNNATNEITPDDDSQSSTGTSSKRESKKFRTEVIVPESTEVFTVDKVIEYVWPLDDFSEHYFIQEHISRYLGIMSFKRKYPDIRRRFIEKTEKEYLKERGIVNEMACDMGLTAARSEDVMDIIFNDFPDKYEELHKDLRDRKEQKFKEEGRADYQVASLDKSKMQEYSKKAAADAARWNLSFNRERYDERRYSFDLQSFTMQRPIGRCQKLPSENTKLGSYPLAVLPGQYTDYYRKYTSTELKSMPVHSVLTGPFTVDELDVDTNQECDEVHTKKEEKTESKEVLDVVDSVITTTKDPMSAGKQPRCKECNGGRDRNKVGKAEPLIICGSCRTPSHPTCIDLTLAMLQKIESYGWQCMECKTCAQCNDPNDEERMIFCDMCDRGYHIYCVGLRKVPNGRWHCRNCACCYSCGTRSPAGNEIVKVAEWQHEFKKNKDTKEVNYVCTLCLTCDRYWKRRMYCNSCWKVYKNLQEGGMVKCAACPKYIHREGCSTLLDNENLCNYCVKSRKNTAMNHSRILAAAKKKMAAGY